jgi:D-alanyl-D-alanine-carboxypeptidase/D-alanyl-D-alanine-endopeptidase
MVKSNVSQRARLMGSLVAVGAVIAVLGGVSPAVAEEKPAEINAVMTPELHDKIQARIEAFQTQYDIVGISVAVVTRNPDGGEPVTSDFAVGLPSIGSATPVDASTQFEIGSQTKVFTADLLAYLVAEGRVSLDDPVQKYAPAGTVVPVWTDTATGEVTPITLRDLATHQAGLVDQPQNYWDACDGHPNCDNAHPYYTQTMLWQNLADNALLWKPGTNWMYSNFGFGLLGTILANIIEPTPEADPPKLESAFKGAFLEDLKLSATKLGTGPLIATPYTYPADSTTGNVPTMFWEDTNALAGEGGLVSSATDMAIWDKAHLGDIASDAPLGVRTMADTLKPQTTITTLCQEPNSCAPTTDFTMGLAWQLYPGASGMGVDWAYKNGGTAGTSSDTALAPSKGVAVTAMWNKQRPANDDAELAPELLSLILHFKAEEKHPKPDDHRPDHADGRLADTGLDPFATALPGAVAATSIAAGLFLVRRRRGVVV